MLVLSSKPSRHPDETRDRRDVVFLTKCVTARFFSLHVMSFLMVVIIRHTMSNADVTREGGEVPFRKMLSWSRRAGR